MDSKTFREGLQKYLPEQFYNSIKITDGVCSKRDEFFIELPILDCHNDYINLCIYFPKNMRPFRTMCIYAINMGMFDNLKTEDVDNVIKGTDIEFYDDEFTCRIESTSPYDDIFFEKIIHYIGTLLLILWSNSKNDK